MDAKIFVVCLPSMRTIAEDVVKRLEKAFSPPVTKPCCFDDDDDDFEEEEEFTVPKFNKRCEGMAKPWGIGGKKSDENLRFGYGLQVDEPRVQDYDSRFEFESDHRAYDRFVEAGEDCVARGMEKKGNQPIHKCNAIRKPLGCPPPMRDEIPGGELIGETQWWNQPCW